MTRAGAPSWEDVYCHACGGGLGTLNDDVRAAIDAAFRAGQQVGQRAGREEAMAIKAIVDDGDLHDATARVRIGRIVDAAALDDGGARDADV